MRRLKKKLHPPTRYARSVQYLIFAGARMMMHGTRILFGYANSRETQEQASSDLYTFYESPLDRIHFLWSVVVLWSRARANAFLFSSSPQFQSSTTVDEISRWMMTIGAATFYTTTTDRKTELLLLGGVRHALQLLLPPSPKYTTLLLLLLLSSFIPSATELVLLWCSFVRSMVVVVVA